MKLYRSATLVTLITLTTLIGCKRTTYSYPDSPVANYYMPLTVGKYAIYQLDSLTFYYYGQKDTVTHYLAKDTVESPIVDNIGRPGWRIVRYLNDVSGAGTWYPTMVLWVTPTRTGLEVSENNLRYIKLAFPTDQGYSWSGNSYLPYDPYQDFFDYSDDSHLSLGNWTYSYDSVDKPYKLGNTTYDSTLTVVQANDSINVPITDVKSFASKTYWVESYAKHVGLVYRHTAMWEYQPPTPTGSQAGYKIGFEVTLTLLSHN